MAQKRVIIVGHNGQDGSLLLDDLKKRGDEIIGIGSSSCIFPIGLTNLSAINILDPHDVYSIVEIFRPNEIYYLAAYHASSESCKENLPLHEQFKYANQVHVEGLVNFMSSIVDKSLATRIFYASSSLVFSGENGEIQDENTSLTPQEFYGITKAQGMWLCKEFRRKYNLFVSVGILYNHESHLRPPGFLSTKIIQTAYRISQGSAESLEIGNLSARVDWGYAKDYVLAFQKILLLDYPTDFIVSSGKSALVNEFVKIVFNYFGLDPLVHVIENPNIVTRKPASKIGNSFKLRSATGWKPSMNFFDFVIQLINDHLEVIKQNA